MEGTVRLRTLTRKSRIPYGKYEGRTVQEMLDNNNKKAISWLYYNVAWITFTDDVLEECHIKGQVLIEKPGINPDLYRKTVEFFLKRRLGDNANFIIYNNEKKRYKRSLKQAEKDENLSPARLQAMNHGHITL